MEGETEGDSGGHEPADSAASRLTDDLILQILSRLPARSLHRFRCVSRHWRDLICNPDHRSMMAQTIAGFFYIGWSNDDDVNCEKSLRFAGASSAASPLLMDPRALSSFPPGYHDLLHRVECSNGILLLTSWAPSVPYAFKYAVCNPGTDEWTPVPDPPDRGVGGVTARLVFDPASAAARSSYRIFQFQSGGMTGNRCPAAWIYASETRAWAYKKCGWENGAGATVRDDTSCVLFQGKLLLSPKEAALVWVDPDGEAWGSSPKPRHPHDDGFIGGPPPGFIGLSQGRLQFLNSPEYCRTRLCVWERGRGGGDDLSCWVLKHTLELFTVFGGWDQRVGLRFSVIGIHPDRDVVYFLEGRNYRLVACAMGRGAGTTICELGVRHYLPYLPYVPVFSRSLTG